MGQVGSIETINFTTKPLRAIKERLADLDSRVKYVYVLVGEQKNKFRYKEGITRVGNLLFAFRKTHPELNTVAFRTETGSEILDFMLANPKFLLSHLKNKQMLKPVELVPNESDDLLSSFVPLKTLGKGGFSFVTLIRKKSSGQLFAIKSLNKDHIVQSQRILHTLSERKILSKLSHPFILSLQCSFQTVLYM